MFLRHMGVLVNRGIKVALVIPQLTESPDSCLVCYVENLPNQLGSVVQGIIEGPAAANTDDLSKVLAVNYHLGQTVLMHLHSGGFLHREKISNVMMRPEKNMQHPLALLLEGMGYKLPATEPVVEAFNPHAENAKALAAETARKMALNKLHQAKMARDDADRYEAEARRMDPTLFDVKPVDMPVASGVEDHAMLTVSEPEAKAERKAPTRQAKAKPGRKPRAIKA